MSSFLDQVPAGTPPPGVKSNFIDPPSQATSLIVVNVVFASLMTITVCVRLYVRCFLINVLGMDDYFCGAAAIASWMHTALVIHATNFGLGKHLWDIRASTQISESNVRWEQSEEIVFPIAIWLVKMSILLLYLRIFSINKVLRGVIFATTVAITFVCAVFVGLNIATIIQCVNLQSLMTQVMCVHGYPIVLSQAVWNVVTDFWILLLPMRSLAILQLERRRKIGLVAVFGIGAITCIISLARCVLSGQTWTAKDPLWTAAWTSELSAVEINVGIIVASAPALPKFWTKAKTVTVSVYQSLLNRARKGSSSASFGSGDPTVGDHESSELEIVKAAKHNNTVDISGVDPVESAKSETLYNITGPIFRTDSYEVAYNNRHSAARVNKHGGEDTS